MLKSLRRLLGLTAVLALLLTPALPGRAMPADVGNGNLSKADQELLAQARAAGKSEVTVLMATQPGGSLSVAGGISAQGGTVRYKNEALGYIRAVVPIGQVEALARSIGVQAVNLDRLIPLPDPLPKELAAGAAGPAPGPRAAALTPSLPSGDIGATQFVAANPTYDGRGVKMAIIDTGVDPLTPALLTARAQDGTSVPKIVDWVTSIDPLTGNDPTWVKVQTTGPMPAGGRFTVNGVNYVAPTNAAPDLPYRFATLSEADSRLAGELGNDLKRDGNPSTGTFAVLWDTATNTVWVNTRQDGIFTNEKPMTDYRVKYDVGRFGTVAPDGTFNPNGVPFVVQIDPVNQMINIGIVSGAHGTHVAGIAAGKGLLGGAFNGVAPEAQVVSVRACLFVGGCPLHAVTEGAIYAVTVAKVDVVNVSLGGLGPLSDGSNVLATLYDRLIGQYGVQIIAAAGNSGPGMNTIYDPSTGTRVLSVGAYVHRDTWLNNFGVTVTKNDGLFPFSSRGPRADGGFKPDIVAPGAAVSTIPGWMPGRPIPGTFELPPGYGTFAGTSMAAPQASGGAALLLSAAKQSNLAVSPDQLRQAISSGARYLGYYGAHEQGAGLMQVGAAWGLLQAGVQPVAITSSAPVNTVMSYAHGNQGPGLYEREGWAAGQFGQRTITFTRTSGPAGPVTYNLSFTGNDGTFSTAGSLTLPLNTPTTLTVNIGDARGITPMKAGVHSGILNLVDPATGGIAYRVLNTVVAAEQMNALNNFATSYLGYADRADRETAFFNVASGAGAYKMSMQVTSGGGRATLYHPAGTPTGSTGFCSAGATCESGYSTVGRTLSGPKSGVWEVALEAPTNSSASPAGYTVRGSLLGVEVIPAAWAVDPAPVGKSVSQSLTFINRFGGYVGGTMGTSLSSALTARPTIAHGAQQTSTVDVAPGSTSLTVAIGNPSDPRADLDLYVYDPTQKLVGSSTKVGSAESVTITGKNMSGTYTILVKAVDVPAGTTAYDYLDVFANSAFGSVSITDAPAPHPFQDVWARTASVTPMAAPASGRFLQGFVQMWSGSDLIGSTEVALRNVR